MVESSTELQWFKSISLFESFFLKTFENIVERSIIKKKTNIN